MGCLLNGPLRFTVIKKLLLAHRAGEVVAPPVNSAAAGSADDDSRPLKPFFSDRKPATAATRKKGSAEQSEMKKKTELRCEVIHSSFGKFAIGSSAAVFWVCQ